MTGASGASNTGMGIGAFYTRAFTRDFTRDFQMRVISMGPGGIIDEKDNVYITTTTLPGYQLANQQVPFMGLQFNVPGSGSFPGSDSWSVVFRCDAQLNIREKILAWQKAIFNAFPNDITNSVGAYSPKGIESIATLAIMNRDGTTARGMKLIGIYPVTVGELQYNTTGNGAVVEMTVTLAYQWWMPDDTISLAVGATSLAANLG